MKLTTTVPSLFHPHVDNKKKKENCFLKKKFLIYYGMVDVSVITEFWKLPLFLNTNIKKQKKGWWSYLCRNR